MIASKGRKHYYEAMFLVSQSAATDVDGMTSHINEILNRAHAEIVALRKWDERRLAYEINKQKRGTYILAYFACDPANLAHIERDCNLSERVLRSMILRADHLSVDEMQATDNREALATEGALRAGGEEFADTADA
jgi:small subunit ribosomal protein S6